jgi:hypothetical protein
MKAMTKVLLGAVAVAVVLAVSAPVAEAQCATGARNIASIGGAAAQNKLRINPAGSSQVLGTEYGRMWQCNDSSSGNNFDPASGAAKTMALAGTGHCATQGDGQAGGGWWQVAQTTLRGVDGLISGTGCVLTTCPVGDMCLVVENYDTAGPPGVNGDAYFIGWRTEQTPPNFRYWDLSKFCGAQDTQVQCEVPFTPFPIPFVTSAATVGTDRALTTDSNTDPSINVYVHTPNAGPASALIESYDLMIHIGPSDPGRDRNASCPGEPNGKCWNPLATISYADAAVNEFPVNVPCGGEIDDAYIAFGLTFEGGPPGGPVPSQMVGRAIAIECGGNIADPKQKPGTNMRLDERPTGDRAPARSRSGR